MGDDQKVVPRGEILIVDDIPANLRLLANTLIAEGYAVRSARNGFMALAYDYALKRWLALLHNIQKNSYRSPPIASITHF